MPENNLNIKLLVLTKSINDLKNKLYHAIDNNIISESLKLSQELDNLIIQYYKDHSNV